MKWESIWKNAFFLVAPLLLVFLMATTFPARPTDGVKHLKNVVGLWEGWFTWPDQTRSYPISLLILPDGSYEFSTYFRDTKGRAEIKRGRIQLNPDTLEESTLFSRGLISGKPVLLGDHGNYGNYRLNKKK